ncbi:MULTISPECIES: hypothetical protein [Neisseria]|uniref:hypothetical protein n=1 Tax=Neisseria TaxID=482 RepID=UPI000D318D55|nr:hypothetical protein [Neisseria bergeri]
MHRLQRFRCFQRFQTAFFTQFPPFPVIPDNTVISKPVIPAQAGIQTCPHRNLSDKNSCPNPKILDSHFRGNDGSVA